MERMTVFMAGLLALLVADAAGAQKVYIDFDRGADLTKYKTYAIAATKGAADLSALNPLAHQRVVDGMRERIAEGGRLTEDESNPDLFVTYHVTSEDAMSVNTSGYGYGPMWGGAYAWGRGGWMSVNTTVDTYTTGTLLIDVWDAKTEQAVWRGIATGVVPSSPKKGMKKLDSALDKLAKKWEQMRTVGK